MYDSVGPDGADGYYEAFVDVAPNYDGSYTVHSDLFLDDGFGNQDFTWVLSIIT